jgi:hypothetical protein
MVNEAMQRKAARLEQIRTIIEELNNLKATPLSNQKP